MIIPHRKCILVLGMHRSGTSAFSRVFSLLGAGLPKRVLVADSGNERGYWEPERLVAIHDRMLAELSSRWDDWRPLLIVATTAERFKAEISLAFDDEYGSLPLITLKDPRICRFVPFYLDLLIEKSIEPLIVIPIRNPLAVAASLQKRNGITIGFASLLWMTHVLAAERATRGSARVIISYERLVSDWQSVISSISSRLNITWPLEPSDVAPQISEFIVPQLQHYNPSWSDLAETPVISTWVKELYATAVRLETDPDTIEALHVFDQIRDKLDEFTIGGEAISIEMAAREAVSASAMDRLKVEMVRTRVETDQLRNIVVSQNTKIDLLRNAMNAKEVGAEISQLRAKLALKESERNGQRASLDEAQVQLANRNAKIMRLTEEKSNLEQALETAHRELHSVRSQLYQIYSGWSWRVTTTMRKSSLFSRLIAKRLLSNSRRKAPGLVQALANLRNAVRHWRACALLRKSPFFDAEYYLTRNADVKEARFDPAMHYLSYGAAEGRNPSARFDTNSYLAENRDVAVSGANPLVHYLRYGAAEGREAVPPDAPYPGELDPSTEKLSSILSFLGRGPQLERRLSEPVTIIAPVHNGRHHLEKFLPSLFRNTEERHNIVIVDDASSDIGTRTYLEEICKSQANVTLLRNEANLGFVRSVNRGADLAGGNFVILNTDIVLPPYWLERLMRPIFDSANVSSATPFSNAATIFSFPQAGVDNTLIDGLSPDRVDHTFSHIMVPENFALEAPSGVGFCMGVKGEVWREIGGFDAIAFDRGYGEENDWCQRAASKGYKNVLAPNLFVFHAHGGSFGADEKRALIDSHLREVARRWPNYLRDVGEHISSDPWKRIREGAFFHLCCVNQPLLILDHDLGGGANEYRNSYIERRRPDGRPIILITYDVARKGLKISAQIGQYRTCYSTDSTDELRNIIERLENAEIVINDLVSWSRPVDTLTALKRSLPGSTNRLVVLFHDFYAVCPSYNLLNSDAQYCGVPDDHAVCDRCLPLNAHATSQISIRLWREHWGEVLALADKIVFFSQSSAEIVKRAFALNVERIAVEPHLSLMQSLDDKIEIGDHRELIVGVVGNINLAKGAMVVSELSHLLAKTRPDARIVVLGQIDLPYRKRAMNLIVHGRYQRAALPQLLVRYRVKICVLPSIWPETFSYVAQELMQLGMPLICFNLGAPAERVSKYEAGTVVSQPTAEAMLEGILNHEREWLMKR